MKKIVALLLAVLLLFSVTACGGGSKTEAPSGTTGENGTSETEEAKGDIVIGCLQDITGVTSTLGKMVEEGAKWAADEINANGGVNGRQIKVVTYDTKADVQEAINAFKRMCTTDKVSAVIGPPVANIGIAIAPISEQYNIPVLHFAIDDRATIKDDGTPYKNMFLFQPSAKQQAAIMAQFAVKEKGLKKIGIIYNQSNAYSVSLVEPFKKVAVENGGQIVGEVTYQPNDKDFKTMLNKLVSAGAEAIYAPNYTQELILIVQQARAIGFNGPLICGLDACPPFPKLCGPEADGVIYINNITETEPQIQDIITAYKEKTGNDATNKFFLGYDVMKIIASTIEKVGDDPAAIRDAIENLTNYEGLTGTITIDPATHQPKGLEMVMHEIKNQAPVMLKRYSASE
ncbi:ABC transporter substrate-binding protein [Tepidanaerobacter syntrophicus]|uniref:Branched-chain amino acid transport system substrate-binding protein n=1 Tax=Tepidanaerobacter syntrophicus TaxID=224999 RepID=A0A0U9HCV0_9FIRM|nr:ABC transporter substrate-binding protein [Tepidanaerobacter syntrophicus]GAQ24624.1 branched-chain amino acid transport system substrate-binding protein [Tepidanaerobacter syntrophicus]HHV83260.1 ABC transporter substrate-binding protein [Tepidanaerobacter syntrophicus]